MSNACSRLVEVSPLHSINVWITLMCVCGTVLAFHEHVPLGQVNALHTRCSVGFATVLLRNVCISIHQGCWCVAFFSCSVFGFSIRGTLLHRMSYKVFLPLEEFGGIDWDISSNVWQRSSVKQPSSGLFFIRRLLIMKLISY